jgi:hypothetical protein
MAVDLSRKIGGRDTPHPQYSHESIIPFLSVSITLRPASRLAVSSYTCLHPVCPCLPCSHAPPLGRVGSRGSHNSTIGLIDCRWTARILPTTVLGAPDQAPFLFRCNRRGNVSRDVTRLLRVGLGIDNLGLDRPRYIPVPKRPFPRQQSFTFLSREHKTSRHSRAVNPKSMHHTSNFARDLNKVISVGHDMYTGDALGLRQRPYVEL